jgi:hypothetical protein
MARAVSEKVGRGTCPSRDCNDLVMYRRSSGGMLTHKCDGCDSSGYAIPGSTAHTQRMASIAAHAPPAAAVTPPAAAPSPPAAAPSPAIAAPSPAAKARNAFNLMDL